MDRANTGVDRWIGYERRPVTSVPCRQAVGRLPTGRKEVPGDDQLAVVLSKIEYGRKRGVLNATEVRYTGVASKVPASDIFYVLPQVEKPDLAADVEEVIVPP